MFRTVTQQRRCFLNALCDAGIQDAVLQTQVTQMFLFVLLPVFKTRRVHSGADPVLVALTLLVDDGRRDVEVEDICVDGFVGWRDGNVNEIFPVVVEHVMSSDDCSLSSLQR